MWSSVAPDDPQGSAPSARAKHSATIVGEYVYVLGGRNGNLPLKDFWRYNLVTGKWQQLKPTGDKLPSLQEHTAVAYKDNIYVFGGEVSFSASTETPLWVYDIRNNSFRKVKTKKGVATPKGRRGHTALVHNGAMLIYGGYQDLKGSCGDLWAFHFDTESWHLVFTPPNKSSEQCPPSRHKHSAAIHEETLWIYGGMTDLQERSDLWKFDFYTKIWTNIKTKVNPGPLHSHACCKMPSSMILFGGERNGQSSNDLWKFIFDVESWEKIVINGVKPQPRSESRALIVSELLLNGSSKASFESKTVRIRARTCNSVDRGNRHSSYLPNNRVAPSENTYVFQPSQFNYTDGSNLVQQYSDARSSKTSFLQEITKLSQINISKISNKCNYTVLSKGRATDSTESLLRQHSSPQQEINTTLAEPEQNMTPSRGTMVKSKSAYVIKKKYHDSSPTTTEEDEEEQVKEVSRKKRVEFDSNIKKIPREPISVPNFSMLTLPTPVLTPVEASKLVYLTDEETDVETKASAVKNTPEVESEETEDEYDNLKPLKRADSYSSHLGYADNPLYQEMIEKSEELASSTSDYYSIETVNRLSSASSYSVKTNTPQENKETVKEGPFGFCNPNYLGPSTNKSMLTNDEKKSFNKIFPSDTPEHRPKDEEDILELLSYDGILDKNTKVIYRQSSRSDRPANLPLHRNHLRKGSGHRAHSAGRAENRGKSLEKQSSMKEPAEYVDPFIPLYVYIIGGKEQGHVTVFQRPISIWRLKLF
ncbi:tip elongation aberrant protein 1-like [Sitophilus oryzae]|uniref:Tip elongation aberrant protein 1-like n=1 Tax=Sitophilus oryzae TaxID=7048 RepID=A0A6J2YD53_SITOR|nr:tip elongation aberrant protein 1-like [Sitophilus oryzae]